MAEAIAKAEGVAARIEAYNSEKDYDDGVSPKQFSKLLDTRCDFVMGFPIESGQKPDPMPGIAQTKSYAHTGFVLVVAPGLEAKSLGDFPQNTSVAVTFETVPTLYFLDHKNVKPDVQNTEDSTLKALVSGQDKAAILWQPTIETYLAGKDAKFAVYPLDEPHANFDVVALYAPRSADEAKTFDDAIAKVGAAASSPVGAVKKESGDGFDPAMVRLVGLDASGGTGGSVPAIYTKDQADSGESKFSAHCAVCHGDHLQGKQGPALVGANFGSVKAGFSVGDIFTIVANNMPASAPGSLQHDDYVEIMAFLLRQNGYPAGPAPLAFDAAGNSTVPFLYRGK